MVTNDLWSYKTTQPMDLDSRAILYRNRVLYVPMLSPEIQTRAGSVVSPGGMQAATCGSMAALATLLLHKDI
jgi:hypothetical protein